ncbi:hypothetical protein [Deinococcus ruber]|uniref:Uncharacterized protein n=1 Tax=Deinococcus ruber TaxID=1848197 RepID=A0A918CAC3_9DEIO|nr:hypothetical protein [Deinococcus ruber]GGR11520.1 hypothetical protein GCM10008957_25530 [Deinococcus ruber]
MTEGPAAGGALAAHTYAPGTKLVCTVDRPQGMQGRQGLTCTVIEGINPTLSPARQSLAVEFSDGVRGSLLLSQVRVPWFVQQQALEERQASFSPYLPGKPLVCQAQNPDGLRGRRGQTCTVVEGPDASLEREKQTLRVRFSDSAEATLRLDQVRVPTRNAQLYRERPAQPAQAPDLRELRNRPSYKGLVQAAVVVLKARDTLSKREEEYAESRPEDSTWGTVEAEQQEGSLRDARAECDAAEAEFEAYAVRNVRGYLRAHPGAGDAQTLTHELQAAALEEARTRFLQRAGRARLPSALPVRPASLMTVTTHHIAALQRLEQNRIARAILLGQVIPDQQRQAIIPRTQSQPKSNVPVGDFEVAFREMQHHAMLCVRYTLTGVPTLAEHHARLCDDTRAQHDALLALLNEKRVQNTGRYLEGERFFVDLPATDQVSANGEESDDEEHYFTLVIVWGEDGGSLVIANDVECEVDSGVYVGEQGWNSLTHWLEHHDQRLSAGAQRGRQFEDEAHLIWKKDRDSYVLRSSVREKYPGIELALEALRCLARTERR